MNSVLLIKTYPDVSEIYRDRSLTTRQRQEAVAAWRAVCECDLHGQFPDEIVTPVHNAIVRAFEAGAPFLKDHPWAWL